MINGWTSCNMSSIFIYISIRLFFPNLSCSHFFSLCYAVLSFPFCIASVNLVTLAIKLPHTLRCNLQFTIIVIKTSSIFYIRTSLQRTLILTWLSNLTVLSDSVHNDKRSFWWHWRVHWHRYLLLRDELRILSKSLAFTGNPWCFAICINCFEKCTCLPCHLP